jgi:hypothetical protein
MSKNKDTKSMTDSALISVYLWQIVLLFYSAEFGKGTATVVSALVSLASTCSNKLNTLDVAVVATEFSDGFLSNNLSFFLKTKM